MFCREVVFNPNPHGEKYSLIVLGKGGGAILPCFSLSIAQKLNFLYFELKFEVIVMTKAVLHRGICLIKTVLK